MVEIIVNGRALDIYPEEIVSIVLAINDISSIESREGNYSNKFTVPSTSNNNSIFGYANELNFVGAFKPTKSSDARISISGLDVQYGIIQVEDYNELDSSFSISFFSGNTEWMDLISDKNISDIRLEKFNHIWDSANIAASFTNDSGYIYPLIEYGLTRNLNTNNSIIQNWMPAMYSHTLVRCMFQDVGWKVGGSIFTDPIFLRHVVPFSRQKISLGEDVLTGLSSEALLGSYTYVAGATIVFPNVTEGTNTYGNYDNTTGIYTSSQIFSCTIKARAVSSPVGVFSVRINGIIAQSAGSSGSMITLNNVILNAGDTVDVIISINGSNINARSQFTIIPDDNLVDGMEVDMKSTVPEMSQEAFIQTIFNQFGIIFTSDNISQTVYLNRFEDIKDNTKESIDWTQKIDKSRELELDYTELVSDYGRKNTLGYKENEDDKIVDNLGANPFYGNGSFDIDNDFISKEEEIFESEFTASVNVRGYNNNTTLMFVPRYSNEFVNPDEPNVDPSPRCAICLRELSVSDLFGGAITSINIVGTSNTTNVTEVPFVYFNIGTTGVDDIDSVNQNLSFGDTVFPVQHKNLITTYYEDFVRILNSPRRLTAYFLLNERDINNLDFLKPIYLGGSLNNYFYINKISDYRPNSGGVTKVELILIV